MTDPLRIQMQEASYKSLNKVAPEIVNNLKALMRSGVTAKDVEKRYKHRPDLEFNIMINSMILAAEYIESHREVLTDQAQGGQAAPPESL